MNTPCRQPKRRVSRHFSNTINQHLTSSLTANDEINATPKADTEFFFDFDEESKLHLQLALLTTKDAPSMKAAAACSQFSPRQEIVSGVKKLDDTESTADSSCSSSLCSSSSSDTFADEGPLLLGEDEQFDDEYEQEDEDDYAAEYVSDDDGEDDSTVSYTHDSHCDDFSIHSFSSSSSDNDDVHEYALNDTEEVVEEEDHSFSLDEVVSPRCGEASCSITSSSAPPTFHSAPQLMTEVEPLCTPVPRESKPILKLQQQQQQPPLPSSSPTKRVRFGSAKVREYALTVGAYSSVDDSCPLQLSWEHSPCRQMPLRDMLATGTAQERAQRQERTQRLRRLSLQERRERIAAIQGISIEEAGTIEYKNILQMIENTKLHIDQALLEMVKDDDDQANYYSSS